METEQAEQHSRLTLSQTGVAVMRINPDPLPEEVIHERDKAQAATLKKAAEKGMPFCEKCEAAG